MKEKRPVWTLPLLNLIPAGLRKTVLIGVLWALSLGAAYAGGYLVGQRNLAVEQGVERVKEVIRWQEKEKIRRVEVKVRDVERERVLQSQLDNVRAERDQLKDVLNAKPDLDPTVFLRLGDVRLLNDGATPGYLGGVPDPARVAAYQEQAPSATSLRTFVGTELDIRSQYNELALRCDTLVDWVQRELIDAQKNR